MRTSALRFLLLLGSLSVTLLSGASRPLVIAHRGASGYLPEHTLEAAAYAHALGADFIEQDLVLSKDGLVFVSHDIHVDTTTDVAQRYPERKRADGRYYAIDFTSEELKSLRVRERVDASTGQQVFPSRFPSRADLGAGFRLCTFEEQLVLIEGLNRSTGRRVGIYPEIKAPAFHRKEGRDLGAVTLALLTKHGYSQADDPVYLQCFDPAELQRLRKVLGSHLKMVQLIGDNSDEDAAADYEAMVTPEGLKALATYAQGVGPHLARIATGVSPEGKPKLTRFVHDAHAAGLLVHPYTFRADALPKGVKDIQGLLAVFFLAAGVDGCFIDQPDTAVRFLSGRR